MKKRDEFRVGIPHLHVGVPFNHRDKFSPSLNCPVMSVGCRFPLVPVRLGKTLMKKLMKRKFRKDKNNLVELLVLNGSSRIRWIIGKENPEGQLRPVWLHSIDLINRFDAKPFLRRCFHQGCKNSATCCTVYSNNVSSVEWWCDECASRKFSDFHGKIRIIRTYQNAIDHIDCYCKGRKTALKTLIRAMAEAKGLPKRVGKIQAENFFK